MSRRRGAGAVLAVAVLGVIVLSVLVLTQGYLSDSISRADAVLAGRQAEYVADAAVSEALWKLQEGRNAAFRDLFVSGGTVTISPDLTRGVTASGVTLEDVTIEVGSQNEFHGDGRGHYGAVDLSGTARVSRRVARITGTSSYRRVMRRYEYKSVQQGPHPDFQPYTLYARQLVGLPAVEQWYIAQLQAEWERVRAGYVAAIKEDADEVVRVITNLQGFVQRVIDALVYARDWPNMLSDRIAGRDSWSLNPKPDIELGPLSIGKVDKVRLELDGNGDAHADAPIGGGWKNDRSEIPPVRPLIRDYLYGKLRDALEQFFPGMVNPGTSTVQLLDDAVAELSLITEPPFDAFYTASESNMSPVDPLVWRAFREDGADLTAPATFTVPQLRHDELILKLEPKPTLPDSPLRRTSFPLIFDPDGWRNILNKGPGANYAGLKDPFLDADDLWDAAFAPYLQAWSDELQRYEELILLANAPGETPITYDYWGTMASYEFPDPGTMSAYIASRWGGNAGAVYRFPGGSLDLGSFQGDATFAAQGAVTVQGSPAGAMNVVTRDRLSVGGAVRANLMSSEAPVRFDGATVTGMVAARGLGNAGAGALDPFTIVYDPFAGAPWTVNVSEYPVALLVDRGD